MKRRSVLIVAIFATLSILLTSGLFVYRHSQATPAPLATTVDVTGNVYDIHDIDGVPGRSLYTSDLIQPGSNWTVSMDYTQLNGSASVLVLSADGSILDIKRATAAAGNLTFTEVITQPVRLSVYASSWHLVVN